MNKQKSPEKFTEKRQNPINTTITTSNKKSITANSKIAKVALPLVQEKEFDYLLPKEIRATVGCRILVDFKGKKTVGILTGICKHSNIEKIKPVIEMLDANPVLSKENINLAKQLSKLYPYPANEFLFMMLPAYLKKPKKTNMPCRIAPEKKQGCQTLFIKGNTFKCRYKAWKETVRKKMQFGSVMIIFPQISYLEEAKKLIQEDFPLVKVIHSYKNEKELFDNWNTTRNNALILGSRIALFYYPSDLQLIVIEEENSPYYSQEEKPFHNTLDTALFLSSIKKNELILSSNRPALNTYNRIKNGEIRLHEEKSEEREITVVNIGEHKNRLISPLLVELLQKNLADGKRIVIIWNKIGFGSCLTCSYCGYILKCERCSAFLKLSLAKNRWVCSYCGKEREIKKTCDSCKTGYIQSSGFGIEKVESTLKRIFPEVKVARWENRSINTQIILATSKILSSIYREERFEAGFFLDADNQMSRPDYDATFNTYIYLKKLALLFTENLYVFTHNNAHYLFETINQEWGVFYEKELAFRNELKLPPFASLAKITVRSFDEKKLLKYSTIVFEELKNTGLNVYGPFKEQPFKLRGKYRYSITIKSNSSRRICKVVKTIMKKIRTFPLQVAAIIR